MLNSTLPLLHISDLHVYFQTGNHFVHAVQGVSLTLQRGETLALVGESGSGKTVTGLSILRLLPYPRASHPQGQILFEGEDLLQAPQTHLRHIRTGRIGMIFQEPMTSLNPLHTVQKQIGEILALHKNLRGHDKAEAILELLNLAGFPDGRLYLHSYPHQLSGGQRQRVMIAMALACQPILLIADEPTTALDKVLQAEFLNRLKKIQKKDHMAILLITHDLGIVDKMADTVAVMKQGQVVEYGPRSHILCQAQHSYTKKLLSVSLRSPPIQCPTLKQNRTLLDVSNLSVFFRSPKCQRRWWRPHPKFQAVNQVSFTLYQGETLGLLGESGSGKTSLALAILRLIPSIGKISFQGANLSQTSKRQLRQNLQFVFQDPFGSLNPRLTIGAIISEGLSLHPQLSKFQRVEKAKDALETVGLSPEDIERYPHEFSGGQRQRIAIARVLILRPSLIILDEPTSALDLCVQEEILNLLKQLQERYHLSYLMISHDLQVLRFLCHRTLVMKEGEIVEQGITEQLFQSPQHPYTRQLMKAALEFSRHATGNPHDISSRF